MAGGESGKLSKRESSELVPSDYAAKDERILEIRESMARSREEIAENLERIRHEFRDAVDWRGWVERNPWKSVGIAFGLGFMTGFH